MLEKARIALRTATGISFWFDKVVNATGFQSMIPRAFEENLPLHAEVYYQVNVGLHYVDRRPSGKPISRIVMDGWFPCLMPLLTDDERPQTKYVITHGSHTITASCRRQEAAEEQLESLTDEVVESTMKIPIEGDDKVLACIWRPVRICWLERCIVSQAENKIRIPWFPHLRIWKRYLRFPRQDQQCFRR